ncbi:MAG: hypothetical protein QXW43_06140 [Candidatus Methanomethyliaceae archaeon]
MQGRITLPRFMCVLKRGKSLHKVSATSHTISVLTTEDLFDILNIVRIPYENLDPLKMRQKIAIMIKRAFNASGVVFFASDREGRQLNNLDMVGTGINPKYLYQWATYYCHLDPLQREQIGGMVCKITDIIPPSRWIKLRIYNEFYRPQNIYYKLSMSLKIGDRLLGRIGVFRPKDGRDFSKREIQKANMLVRYLSIAIWNAFQLSEMKCKELFYKCMEGQETIGIIVLDSDLKPVFMSKKAKELCLLFHSEKKTEGSSDLSPLSVPRVFISDCLNLKEMISERKIYLQQKTQPIIRYTEIDENSEGLYIITSL